MEKFTNFCQENSIIHKNITFTEWQKFVNSLQLKRLDNGTINNYIIAVKKFYEFLIKAKEVEQNYRRQKYQFRMNVDKWKGEEQSEIEIPFREWSGARNLGKIPMDDFLLTFHLNHSHIILSNKNTPSIARG